jgi:hypothetical protein
MERNILLLTIFYAMICLNLKAETFGNVANVSMNDRSETFANIEPSAISKDNNIRKESFILSLGVGASYSGWGARVQYFLGENKIVALQGGVGYTPGHGGWILASGGVKLYHRDKNYYVNAQFGGVGSYYDRDANPTTGRLIGASFLIGYDWFFANNLGLNFAGGGTFAFIGSQNSVISPMIDLGLIYKFNNA